jgi:hypothetical protein
LQLAKSVPVVFAKKMPTTFLMQVESDMDLQGDCATIGLVRVDKEDKKMPLTLDLKGVIFRGAPLHCSTFAVVDIGTVSTGGGKTKDGEKKPKAPVQQLQQAKVTHLINGFFSMERSQTQETEIVGEGTLDDLDWKEGGDVVPDQKDADPAKAKAKKKTTKKKTTKAKGKGSKKG